MIVWNARNLSNPITGVQRYTREIVARLPADAVSRLEPPTHWSSGIRGHMWEQFVLPSKLGQRLLWSPANTGPLAVSNQVLSVMDMSPLDNPERLNPKFAAWYGFLLPRLIRRARMILTISEFSRERILHHVPGVEDRVRVTPLAADARFVPANAAAIANLRSRLCLPTPRYIVALGSVEPRKNLPRLIRAWRTAQARISDDISLVIAGGAGKSMVFGDQNFGALPARTIFTGRVDDADLPALYTGAIASVYVSLYEGFGLPPLESMSCGTPVVASDAGSIPEVVGDTAILVDPLDDESIAEGIVRIVNDADCRRRLSDDARARSAKFDWDETARQTWACLKEASEW